MRSATRSSRRWGFRSSRGAALDPQDTATSRKVAMINQALAKKRFPNVESRWESDSRPATRSASGCRSWAMCADTRYANLRDDCPGAVLHALCAAAGSGRHDVCDSHGASACRACCRRCGGWCSRAIAICRSSTCARSANRLTRTCRWSGCLRADGRLSACWRWRWPAWGSMASWRIQVAQSQQRDWHSAGAGSAAGPGARHDSAREHVAGACRNRGREWAAALVLTRLVKSMLYGIQPYDPLTIFSGVLILMAVALAASWIPARRAAGVQPMEALRHE